MKERKVKTFLLFPVITMIFCTAMLGCPTEATEEGDGKASEADYAALSQQITTSKTTLASATRSVDGADVVPAKKWVPVSVYEALQESITAAEALAEDSDVLKSAIQNVIKDLKTKDDAFTAAKKSGTAQMAGNFTALEQAADSAAAAMTDVVKSADGSDVPISDIWVETAVYEALDNALTQARTIISTKLFSQAQVDAAASDLSAKTTAFNAGKTLGTGGKTVAEIKTEIQAAITAAANLLKYTDPDTSQQADVKQEAAENNIPGLFVKFGHYWVTTEAAAAFNQARTAAEAYVASAAASTPVEAAGVYNDFTAAVDAATPKEGLGLEFVDVPAGKFTRYAGGDSLGTTGYESTITKGYKLSKYEITIGQWEAVMGTGWPSTTDGSRYDSKSSPTLKTAQNEKKFPAVRLNWYDAIAFSNRLSARLGKPTVYTVEGVTDWANVEILTTGRPGGADNSGTSANAAWDAATANWDAGGYRLPTGWEHKWAAMGAYADATATITDNVNTNGYRKAYAGQSASAAATDGKTYTGRSGYAHLSLTDTNAVENKDGTAPVGSYLPNELGLYDMSGNASEWVWDGNGSGNNHGLGATGALSDYRGPSSTTRRDMLGGDWENGSAGAVVNDRPSIWNNTGGNPHCGYTQTGIRLAINAE
ncbi:MAG: formylglycine-generating enzyme family protein [Treponema sp.]|jgi:formylglycine-generating enzyme required for sulfatase activity|nr:formylglycine-generating enzyme family protein [Treponema sp.]